MDTGHTEAAGTRLSVGKYWSPAYSPPRKIRLLKNGTNVSITMATPILKQSVGYDCQISSNK